MLDLYYSLNEAYGKTTQNYNFFKEKIESIKWDDTFNADGEAYFRKGNLILAVENINPFAEAWKPTVMIGTFFRELGI